MEFKLLKEKDYTVNLAKVKYRGKVVIPTCKVNVTDKETGELVKGCDMSVTIDTEYDDTPFVKLYRPQLIDQLGRSEYRLFCYIMEKMNRYNVVALDPQSEELYEFTGYTSRTQLYAAIRVLKDKSVLTKETGMTGIWKVSEECMRKYVDTKKEDKRPFVKIYTPRVLMALTNPERAVFYYICVKMDFEGVVNIRMHDFLDLTGYKHRNKRDEMGKIIPEPNAAALFKGKSGLKKKGFIRDISLMVYDGRTAPRKGTYFRVNPNIFFRGNRLKDGHYGVMAVSEE